MIFLWRTPSQTLDYPRDQAKTRLTVLYSPSFQPSTWRRQVCDKYCIVLPFVDILAAHSQTSRIHDCIYAILYGAFSNRQRVISALLSSFSCLLVVFLFTIFVAYDPFLRRRMCHGLYSINQLSPAQRRDLAELSRCIDIPQRKA